MSNFKTANKHLENGHQATGILWSKNGHQAATKMVFQEQIWKSNQATGILCSKNGHQAAKKWPFKSKFKKNRKKSILFLNKKDLCR